MELCQFYFGSDTNDESTPDSFLTVSALFFILRLESLEEDSDDEDESWWEAEVVSVS